MTLERLKSVSVHWILFCVISLGTFAQPSRAELKYIFLMIGDGMGQVQREVYGQYLRATTKDANVQPVMNQLPYHGLMTTYSANSAVTDSAAAGTALACGAKTNNGTLGLDPQGNPLEIITEVLHPRGMKIGIISSVPLDHATPAAFYAHQKGRGDSYHISMQMAQSAFEFFGAAPPSGIAPKAVNDQPHPFETAKENGFHVVTERSQFTALTTDARKVIVSIPVTNDWAASDNAVTLTELTDAAIRCLDNPNGFFIMVEGGAIDWQCHANNLAGALAETAAFDRAVERAREFYFAHPNETLIIVTADHETGGMRLEIGEPGFLERLGMMKDFCSAYGSLSKELDAFKENQVPYEQAFLVIQQCYDFAELPQELDAKLRQAYEWHIHGVDPDYRSMYGSYNPLPMACEHVSSALAGVHWTTFGHSGAPVLTNAIGVGAETFTGLYDNIDIKTKILQALNAAAAAAKL